MPLSRTAILSMGFGLASSILLAPAASAAPSVVTTIKPLHSLVAGVMAGTGAPLLLIEGAASPHGYALKPSQAKMLQDADVVFWIGEDLESSLARPIGTMAEKAVRVELAEAPGITLLEPRDGDGFEPHSHAHEDEHDGHGTEQEQDHEHDHDHDHAKDGHAADGHDGDAHPHDHAMDLHLWLDPENARAMVRVIAQSLSEADPDNAAVYRANAEALDVRLETLTRTTGERLAPLHDKPFVVFHDAYHYFEERFDVHAAGAISLNPEVPASAERIAEISHQIKTGGAVCVFSEPQFESKLVQVVIEGSGARTAVLDPLGTGLDDGPDLYFQMIENLADAFAQCLSGS